MGVFSLDLARFAEKAGDKMDVAVKKISMELLSSVVLKSPVDTGRFRGNWNVELGKPSYITSDKVDKGGGATIEKGAGIIQATQFNGATLYITNALPYANRLEDGYSNQAPNGMVRITVVEFQEYVNKVVNSL